MKAPQFWQKKENPSLVARFLMALLIPLGQGYRAIVQSRLRQKATYKSTLPVICVGNIVLGGSGKTPVVQALVKILQEQGKSPCILMRGFGGTMRSAGFVDTTMSATKCGDEALLHAHLSPVMVSPDRAVGAHHIEMQQGISHIVMDDGLQNPSLHKTLSLIVLDGRNPFGNGKVFPAGPLRETLEDALPRADGLIVLGDDVEHLFDRYRFTLPVFRARIEPMNPQDFRGKQVLAFAGIGRPEKFFATLQACGAVLTETRSFPDHHMFTEKELAEILGYAMKTGVIPVTTRKDWVRLPDSIKAAIQVLDVRLIWDNPIEIKQFIEKI